MPRLLFLFLIFLAAASGTFIALQLFGGSSNSAASAVPEIITVEIIVTATPDPARQQLAVTATSLREQVDVPADIAATAGAVALTPAAASTFSASTSPTVELNGTLLPGECAHTVVSGDTPYGIAEQYGADLPLLLEINGMTLDSAVYMQPGDILSLPIEGCIPDSEIPPPTNPPPLAVPTDVPIAELEIIEAMGLGDITAEGIRLQNMGENVNLSEWSLTDSAGNRFTFPEFWTASQSDFVIYTRSGTDTHSVFFWNQDQPRFQAGDTLTLRDHRGEIQASLSIPAPVDLP